MHSGRKGGRERRERVFHFISDLECEKDNLRRPSVHPSGAIPFPFPLSSVSNFGPTGAPTERMRHEGDRVVRVPVQIELSTYKVEVISVVKGSVRVLF